MPNRIIRDGILSSEKVAQLDWPDEVFYRRLMSIVDDYGRHEASPILLRSKCYPLQTDKVRAADITRWIAACVKSGVLLCYEAENGKRYLELSNFGQPTRSASKHPGPQESARSCTQLRANEINCAQLHTNDSLCVSVSVSESVCVSESGGESKPKPKPLGAHTLPEDWIPNASHEALAQELGFPLAAAAAFFRDWALSRDKRYSSWDATFRNALRGWLKDRFVTGGVPTAAKRPMHSLDAQRRMDAIRERLRELSENMPKWLPDGSKDHGPNRDNDGTLLPAAKAESEKLKEELSSIKGQLRAA